MNAVPAIVGLLILAAAFLPAAQAGALEPDHGVYGPPGDYIIRSLTPYDPSYEQQQLEASKRLVDSELAFRAGPSGRSNAWEPSVKVSAPPDRTIVAEWDEDVTPQGTLIAGWITSSGGIGCGFKHSTDGGTTWSAPFYADGSSSGGDPVIIPDRSIPGTVYIVCIVQKSGQTWNVMAKSVDDGKTYTAWDLGASWSPVTLDYPMLVAKGQRVVMAFNQGQADTNAIYSDDGGKTWSAKKDVAAGWPNCIEEAKDGSLYILSGNGGQSLTFEKSSDMGATWSAASSTGISGQSRAGCATDHVNGDLYVVTESNTAVTVIHSSDGGTSWTSKDAHTGSGLGGQSTEGYASVAVDNTGAVHVGFISNENSMRQAYYTKSTDKGATWSAVEKISDHTSSSGGQVAHYGHGMSWIPGGTRVCFGYAVPITNRMEYRHTCSGTGGGGGGGGGLARIEVKPDPASVPADQTLQFTATGYNSNNTPMPIAPTWAGTGGTVSAAGLYTPNGPIGTYSVEAAVGNIKGAAVVNVIAGALDSITVSPGSATITADVTQQFTATGADVKGNAVAITPVWSATGGSVDGTGLFTPAATGTFDVNASQGSIKGTGRITVSAGKPVTLKVDPATATVAADATLTFKALATDAKGNDAQVVATWQVDGGTGGGAVSPSGLYTPNKVGSYKIKATAGTLSAEAQVEVTPGKLAKLVLAPKSSSLNVGEKVTFTLNATDSKGNVLTGLGTDWKVVGDIGTVTDGVFSAAKAGSGKVTVTMTDGAVAKTAEATVTVKENPLAAIGFASIMDLLMLIIGLVVLLIIIGVVISLVKRHKRKQGLQTWMQDYDGQPHPERENLQQWMQTYDGQQPPGQQWPPGAGPPPKF